MSTLRHKHKIASATVHLSVTPFSSSLYLSTALSVYCSIYHKAPILLSYVCISMVVLSCVHAQMHFSVSMRRRSCLQVLYEFHLSAAWGTMWRISPNGLVCNCSVNTCLSRLGECGGKKGPSLQRTEATYWAANSYLPLDGGRRRGGPARQDGLCGSFPTPRTSLLLACSEPSPSWARKQNQWLRQETGRSVFMWSRLSSPGSWSLPVLAVCAACCCKALLPLWNLGVDREHLGPGRASSLLGPHMYTHGGRDGGGRVREVEHRFFC